SFTSRYSHHPPPALPSFPTRRSSDLSHTSLSRLPLGPRDWPARTKPRVHLATTTAVRTPVSGCQVISRSPREGRFEKRLAGKSGDRKSTRLNSSHVATSYAVFCLKKK